MSEQRKTLFTVARALIVATVLVAAPPEVTGIVRAPVAAAAAASCTQYSDCAPFVCVNEECVPCWNDDSQCTDLGDYYCDDQTGDCTPGEDCLPMAFPNGTGQCEYCTPLGSGMCPAPTYICDPKGSGICVPPI